MRERSILLAHDLSDQSRAAIKAIESRRSEERITLLDVTKYKWSEPLGYEIPFVTTPEGIFQGLDGVLDYVYRPERFRRTHHKI